MGQLLEGPLGNAGVSLDISGGAVIEREILTMQEREEG